MDSNEFGVCNCPHILEINEGGECVCSSGMDRNMNGACCPEFANYNDNGFCSCVLDHTYMMYDSSYEYCGCE